MQILCIEGKLFGGILERGNLIIMLSKHYNYWRARSRLSFLY